MAKYMGKSSDEIWKLVMGNKQQSGQQEQASTQTGGKTSTSGGRYSGMSADDIYNSVMGKLETDSYKKYQSWVDSADTYTKILSGYTNRRNGAWTKDTFAGNQRGVEQLLGKYNEVAADLDDYDKGQLRKRYNQMKGMYDSYVSGNEFYSKFRDQDDYDRNRSGYGNFGVGYSAGSWGLSDSEARDIRKQQSQKDAQESQRALAEYVAAKKAFTPVDQEYRIHNKGDSDGGAYSDEYEEDLNSRYNQARAKVTAAENALLSARNRMDAYKAGWGKIDQYAKYADAAKNEDTSYTGASFDEIRDYEYKLENEPIHSDREALAPAEVQDKYLSGWLAQNPEPNMDDSLGLWLSMTEAQRQQAAQSTFPALKTLANTANDGLWDQLNDTEIQTYYYLRHNQGQEAALQYLKDLNPELNRRTDESFIETVQNASTAGRWGYEAAAYGLNLIGNVEAGVGELGEMITGNHNPYSNTSRAQRYAGYIRGINGQSASKFVQDVANNAGASEEFSAAAAKYAENTYQAITSGIDSAIGAAVFGPAYLSIMGLGAMAQKSSEQELRGATDRQIAVGAIGAGCIEMLFEKVSLDHFFDNFIKTPPKSWKELIAKTLAQAGIEGTEEINTEIANIAFDAINMGKNCDVSMSIREYMAQGLSEEEAKKRATVDAVTDIYWAGFGGFVSGGVMAGASGTAKMGLSKAANAMDNYDIGKPLLANGRAADLQAQAEALTDAKKSAKLSKAAQEVAHNASVGDNSLLNTYKTGKVATQIAQQAGREARGAETAEFRKAAEKYLEGQRGIQNKKHALNVLTRVYDGTAMLPGDKAYMRMIGGEKLTQEILNSVGGKETLQENAKPSVEASMRTIGNVQSSVLGIAPETKAEFDSDNSGQAFRKSDSEPINILASEPIAKVENGILYLNTDNGQEIAASDVSYGNSGEAAVYAAISNMQTDTETARSLLNGIDDSGLSSAAYARAIQNAYYRGMNGVKFEDTPGYSDAAKLPEAQRRAAWEAGKQRRAAKVRERSALIDSGKAGTRESGVTMQESAKSIRNLNKQQQTGMAAAKALAAAGLHVEVYASTEVERKAGKPNGIYRKADGSIAIDLNAGDNGQGAVAYALAHETTHFIQDYSPVKFETYAELIIAAAESKGISYDSLLARQLARLSEMEEYKNLSETELQDIAYDETIAEMSETILTDTDAASRLSQQIYKQDRTLWQKIKDFFTGLVEKLRNAYRDSDPDSDIGRMLKRAVQDNAEIAQAWAEAVREAGENYQLQDGQKNNARGGERFSLRGKTQQELTANFQAEVDSILNMQDTTSKQVVVGYTPTVYQELGMPSLPLTIGSGHVYSAAKTEAEAQQDGNFRKGVHYHGLGDAAVKNIYSAIQDPVMVIAAKDVNKNVSPMRSTHSVVSIVDIGTSGKSLLVPIEITAERKVNGIRMDVNTISSVYEKSVKNLVTEAIAQENSGDIGIFYAKKEALTLPGAGVQFPVQLQQSIASNGIVHRFSEKVNMKISENTQSQQFKRWFGDWQNDPANASKVVNADGTPKVVYHGTNVEFTVFNSNNGTYWFSESSDYAESMAEERGGNELMRAFLDIKNPYYAKLAPGKFSDPNSEARIIREAKNGGYDGVIIEADTTDELLKDTFYVVFSPNQIKSATDNIGTFDKANPDIRYSSRNSGESRVDRLVRKNEELKAEAEYLKQVVQIQKQGNRKNLRDRESVNAIAKGILESVNAKDTEFGKKLNDFYRDLVTVEMDYDTMQEKAGELADRALEHHQAERDSYAQDILDFLKKRRVSLSDGQIGDIEYSYGSLNDFKRAIKGSIILDQNAETSLDQLWQETAARFPDRFGADTTEADMPDGIANIVSWANSAEADSETEFQYYKAENKADLTRKILMGFLDAKPIESVSDTLKQQMEDLEKQHKQEMQELRKSWDEEAKAMERSHRYDLEAERKRGKAAVEALQYQQEAVQKAQDGLWETERAEIRRSYEKQMKDMEDASDAEMKVMQQEFFRVVREWEKSGKTISELQKQVKELQKGWEDEARAMELSHQYDLDAEKLNTATVQREFNRLLKEYDASDRKVDRLEAKVKQQREAAEAKVESRKKTEERHKLQNTVDTLNRMLLRPTNTSHVPQELQSSVATALDIINQKILDDKSLENARRIRQYAEQIEALQRRPAEAKTQEIEGLQKRIDKLLRENNNGKNDSKIAELNKELLRVRNKQEAVDTDKIAELNRKIKNLTGKDTSMKAALTSLQEQYRRLEGQEGDMFDSNIDALIENAMQDIGNTAYKDLSSEQLKAVRDAYTALLTSIRKTNKTFVAWQDASISNLVKRVIGELSAQKRKKPTQTAIGKKVDQFFWNNEKPVYAFERIGSAVMSELYDNLRKGEDTFYRDVSQARDFFLESAEKNGFSKWDLNELKEFTAADGRKFQLSLDELMSLYAYSLRPQARDHLTKGGIVLAENTKRLKRGPLGVTREVTYDDANAYTLTDETIDAIAGSLTKEQRQFAFEMQQYLAKVMGAKGDEVNMAMYGIKKFGEETYWPLKSSGVFSERIREQQERTGNKVKNSGFTKALTQHANNAIELSSLTETWAQHVNDMSMYHAFTLPMEDFYRVYNWNQRGDSDGKRTMGVRQMIQQTAGKGAVTYIDQFLKDLNGGLRADPRETVSKAMLSGFKKAAVSASLSVAIQQPSAVGRALAYIEPKYFIGSKVEGTKFAETWKQLKKYAAVAGLKEMGRFDVDMGRSTLEYIIGRNGLSTWGKITDKVDEFSGWLPEMADQVTWCGIWEAAKRKTAAQNPGLKGEALLQKAGELFTDTITRTQVYDSVFSRSANMRSKSGLMSMATAFMAEPTTTANMVEDAVRKFARGDKRMAGKVMSSVAVATVLNAALASVVYAARDDDDDKTYWEKYMASLAGETVDSFNPLTYIPVLSDINNLLLGYSIERTDMSLASDLITALKKITTLYEKYDDEWSDEKKKEWEKKVRTAWLDNAWMVGTVMGLPLKNVVRDVEAVINTARNPSNGAEMSADTVLKAMGDSARKNFPILSWKADESSSDQLYKAITQGKDVLARRLKAQFGDEKKYESALLKGLRENDPRIKTAAQYAIDGNTPKRVAIIREIVAEGHYTQDQVIKAINQKANSMKEKTQSGKESPPEKLYDYSEYVNAAANGLGYAGDVQKELIRYQADRNQEKDSKLTRQQAEEDAQKTFRSNVKSDAKDGYAAGELTEAQVRKVLTAADIAEDEELDDLILQWDTELELGDEISWSNARYLDYAETIHPAGISADTYDSYIRAVSRLSSIDEDGDGKTDITKQEQVIEYIDSMPISAEQKDALFQAEYPKARKSVLRKLPWR